MLHTLMHNFSNYMYHASPTAEIDVAHAIRLVIHESEAIFAESEVSKATCIIMKRFGMTNTVFSLFLLSTLSSLETGRLQVCRLLGRA